MGRHNKRDIVLDTAETLFAQQGFKATGINQITKDAGIASMTLYNNFRNKEDLILATMTRRSDQLIADMTTQMDHAGDDPKLRILAIFDALDQWIRQSIMHPDGFGGCSFVRASIEFAAPDHPAHLAAVHHKQRLINLFRTNAVALGHPDPDGIALSLHLLADGALTQAQMLYGPDSAKRAKAIAAQLLDTTAPSA